MRGVLPAIVLRVVVIIRDGRAPPAMTEHCRVERGEQPHQRAEIIQQHGKDKACEQEKHQCFTGAQSDTHDEGENAIGERRCQQIAAQRQGGADEQIYQQNMA